MMLCSRAQPQLYSAEACSNYYISNTVTNKNLLLHCGSRENNKNEQQLRLQAAPFVESHYLHLCFQCILNKRYTIYEIEFLTST